MTDSRPIAEYVRRVRCPYCSKRVALTKTGKLHTHLDPATKSRCGRSGGSPS